MGGWPRRAAESSSINGNRHNTGSTVRCNIQGGAGMEVGCKASCKYIAVGRLQQPKKTLPAGCV